MNYQKNIELNVEQYVSILRLKGVRITPVMVAVLSFLHKSRKYHTPQELQTEIRKNIGYTIGFPTVYRVLQRLLDFDLIYPMFSKRLQACYYLCRSPGTHHHHFICCKCKQVQEVACCTIDGFNNYIRNSLGASVESHIVQIEGLCASCRKG